MNLPPLSIPTEQLSLFEAFGLPPEPTQAALAPLPLCEAPCTHGEARGAGGVQVEQVYGVLQIVARSQFTPFGSLETEDILQEMCIKVITGEILHPGAAVTFAKRRATDVIRTEHRRSGKHMLLDEIPEERLITDGGLELVELLADEFPGLSAEQAQSWAELIRA